MKLSQQNSNNDALYNEHDYDEDDSFSIDNCFDYEGNFDEDRLEDAIMDGLYVPEDW